MPRRFFKARRKSSRFRRAPAYRPIPSRFRRSTRRPARFGRSFKRRFTSGTSTTLIPRATMADRTMLKLPYATEYLLTLGGIGAPAQFTIRGNSLFDPEVIVGGRQPFGFDQYAAFYQRYCVIGSSCMLQASPAGDASAAPNGFNSVYRLNLWPTASSVATLGSGFTNVGANAPVAEQPYGKTRLISVNSLGAAGGAAIVKNYMSTQKMFGVSSTAVMGDLQYSALVSANPSVEWFWNISLEDSVGTFSTATGRFYVYVRVVYYAVMQERGLHAAS